MTPWRRTLEVPCEVEIEQTPESFHAHAVPEGVKLRPGDTVLVHDVPQGVTFGTCLHRSCRATVHRADPLTRTLTRLAGLLTLTSLYEVGFEPQEDA